MFLLVFIRNREKNKYCITTCGFFTLKKAPKSVSKPLLFVMVLIRKKKINHIPLFPHSEHVNKSSSSS